MVEATFCCYGMERKCWNEVYEDGCWDMTLEDVRNSIIEMLKGSSKQLQSKEYQRFYVDEREGYINILAVLMDTKVKHNLKIVWYKKDPDGM